MYHLMSNGRSLPEFSRLLKLLQISDQHGVATPERWQPGEKVILPPPGATEEAEQRIHVRHEFTDWFFF